MKLNVESKNKLRTKIVEELKGVPADKKIKLDKDLLESLLFDEIEFTRTIDCKIVSLKARIPIWSGEFLRHIDLSEVDFSNVAWSILGYDASLNMYSIFPQEVLQKVEEKRTQLKDRTYLVNYSCTNANIDLSRSFEAINDHSIDIRKCNFAGLDFSNQNFGEIYNIIVIESDISGTKLGIPHDINFEAHKSSLCGLDLSDRAIDGWEYLCYDGVNPIELTGCKLCGTHVKVVLRFIKNDPAVKTLAEPLREAMRTSLINCYINDVLVKSPARLASEKKRLQKQYQAMESQTLDDVVTSVQKQLGTWPKK